MARKRGGSRTPGHPGRRERTTEQERHPNAFVRARAQAITLAAALSCVTVIVLLAAGVDTETSVLAVAVTNGLLGVGAALVAFLTSAPRPSVRRPVRGALAVQSAMVGLPLVASAPDARAIVLDVLLAVLVVGGAWGLGFVAGLVVVIPTGAIALGLWRLARGDRTGASMAALGLWVLSIALYPLCLGLAGDGPSRSLGIAPLLGIDSDAWQMSDPGWLWPARVLALLVWGPVAALPVLAVAGLLRSKDGEAAEVPQAP